MIALLLWLFVALAIGAAFALYKKDAELLAEITRNGDLENALDGKAQLLNQAKADIQAYRSRIAGLEHRVDALTAELDDARAVRHDHPALEALRNATGNHDFLRPKPVRKKPVRKRRKAE